MADGAAALDRGLASLAEAYQAGLGPDEVAQEVLDRIEACDDPAIWIDVEPPEALLAAAAEVARSPREGRPLWGVPFAVKDNIDVAGRTTTAGLPGAARTAGATATVVARLQAAGALCLPDRCLQGIRGHLQVGGGRLGQRRHARTAG